MTVYPRSPADESDIAWVLDYSSSAARMGFECQVTVEMASNDMRRRRWILTAQAMVSAKSYCSCMSRVVT